MAKRKKTRNQKILADQRRETQSAALYSFTQESPKQQEKHSIAPVKQAVTIATSSYQYLSKDLTKTAVFTGFIVIAELVLRFLQKS